MPRAARAAGFTGERGWNWESRELGVRGETAQGLQCGWRQVRAGCGGGRGGPSTGAVGWGSWGEGAGLGGGVVVSAESFSVPLQVMGMVRVPLYTQKDRMGGLPNFLANSFVGTAKFQLLFALKILNMVPEEKLAEAVAATQKPKKPAIDHAAVAAAKQANELAAAARAGNEYADSGENQAAAHAAAELAEQQAAGLESQAVLEHLAAVPGAEAVVAELHAQPGADAVLEQPVAEAME